MNLAQRCGAAWAADSNTQPPVELDAAIIFAPVGALVPTALRAVGRGGVVVCGGIHMSDIPSFSYGLLWEERIVRSVANLTREDAKEFLDIAAKTPLHIETTTFPLSEASKALDQLRRGRLHGAAVLIP
jgi:propanol-preferring alcohol dehydrogenase